MEPPETPAPVFAMRAFKSAIFGTPAGEGNDPAVTKTRETPLIRKRNTIQPTVETTASEQQSKENSSSDTANQLSASPTKSILVTPGTTSNRRKTVSFGGTAFHDDPERDQALSRSHSAAPSSAGSVTSQWMSSQSDGKPRPRSKLTQSLLDAKEHPTDELPRLFGSPRSDESSVKNESNATTRAAVTEDHDETVDLNDPRSQSGQYWKTQFENYRKRTNLEMARLVYYQAGVKSYARKKDIEAMRLKRELHKEEEKVAEMERRVTGLASDMMSKDADADRESLVQDLTKQTALALSYKHKVDTLRKALERHGVIGNEDEQADSEDTSNDDKAEILRLQQALAEAQKKLEERSQDDELAKLRKLAKSSEDRVSELERENAILKNSIIRVKGEMAKSEEREERRSDNEAKLKQRANKYEARYEKLKEKMEHYKEAIKEYQESVDQERTMWAQQYQALKEQVHGLSEEKSYAGVQVHDFGSHRSPIPVDNEEEILVRKPPRISLST